MAGGLTKGARAGAGVPLPASERRSVRELALLLPPVASEPPPDRLSGWSPAEAWTVCDMACLKRGQSVAFFVTERRPSFGVLMSQIAQVSRRGPVWGRLAPGEPGRPGDRRRRPIYAKRRPSRGAFSSWAAGD